MKFALPWNDEEKPQSSAFLDVLFILLIAFVMVTSLADDEEPDPKHAMVEVHLPRLEHHEGRSTEGQEKEEMELEITPTGSLRFNGKEIGSDLAGRRTLESLVRERLESSVEPYVRVYADEATQAKDFLPAIALLRELGIAKIDLMGRDAKRQAPAAEGS